MTLRFAGMTIGALVALAFFAAPAEAIARYLSGRDEAFCLKLPRVPFPGVPGSTSSELRIWPR